MLTGAVETRTPCLPPPQATKCPAPGAGCGSPVGCVTVESAVYGRRTGARPGTISDVNGVASAFTQVLSGDAVYEYRADRWWAEGPRLVFVGCNPSLITWQASARLDPTSANCEAIASRDGYPC